MKKLRLARVVASSAKISTIAGARLGILLPLLGLADIYNRENLADDVNVGLFTADLRFYLAPKPHLTHGHDFSTSRRS
jgi:hypothetical protein